MNDLADVSESIEDASNNLFHGLKGPFGKNLLLFVKSHDLANMCRVNTELVDWLKFSGSYSGLVKSVWGEVEAIMAAQDAAAAISEMVEKNHLAPTL